VPAFRRLWLSATLSAGSGGGDFVLVGWLAQDVTGSAAWVGSAFALYYLPMLLFGVPAGSTADRFNRYRLLRALELAGGAVLIVFAIVFLTGAPGLLHVLALPLILGSVRAVQNPVRLSFAYDLVGADHVVPALATMNLGARLGMIVGALGAGTLAGSYGAPAAFLAMALAHGAAWSVLNKSLAVSSSQRIDATPLLQNLRDSAQEVRRNRVLLILIVVTAVVEVFGTSFMTLVPSLAEARLALGAQAIGWMNAAQSGGGFLAGLLLLALPSRRRHLVAYALAILSLGVSVTLLGAAQGLPAILVVLALIAGSICAWDIVTQSLMQLSVPDHLRGRAMGAWVFAIGSAPLGHIQIGLLATAVGAEAALYANGGLVVVTIVAAIILSPALRRL